MNILVAECNRSYVFEDGQAFDLSIAVHDGEQVLHRQHFLTDIADHRYSCDDAWVQNSGYTRADVLGRHCITDLGIEFNAVLEQWFPEDGILVATYDPHESLYGGGLQQWLDVDFSRHYLAAEFIDIARLQRRYGLDPWRGITLNGDCFQSPRLLDASLHILNDAPLQDWQTTPWNNPIGGGAPSTIAAWNGLRAAAAQRSARGEPRQEEARS